MKRNYETQSPTNSMLKDKIGKKLTLKNDLKKLKSIWAHLLNS